jgi:hypothetical protein
MQKKSIHTFQKVFFLPLMIEPSRVTRLSEFSPFWRSLTFINFFNHMAQVFLKRLPGGLGSEPGTLWFHLFSHFFTTLPLSHSGSPHGPSYLATFSWWKLFIISEKMDGATFLAVFFANSSGRPGNEKTFLFYLVKWKEHQGTKSGWPGTDIMIFKIFSSKFLAEKC